MSWIDIVITVVFAVAVVRGFRQGIIGQLGSLAAFVLALIAARAVSSALTGATGAFVPHALEGTPMGGYIASIIAGAIVYAAVYYGVRLVARLIRTVTHALLLGPLDRILGAVFSVLKWGVGLSVGLNLWLALFPKSDFVKESTIGGGIAVENLMELAPWAWGVATHGILADGPASPSDSDADTGADPTNDTEVAL